MKQFLAIYTGSPLAEGMRPSDEAIAAGMTAWTKWMGDHAAVIVDHGGPLGKTKKISKDGITDIRNNMSGCVIIKAESQDEAAKLFEGHPHFAIFPGDGVEVMECLPIPGA
jgi:hypothetical protein